MQETRTYLPRRKLLARYGVVEMTLWRWERDPHLNFPKPIEINGRLYQHESELDHWDRERAAAAAYRRARR